MTNILPGAFVLEQRIMFDGAMVGDVVDATSDGDHAHDATPVASQVERKEVVIIDSSVTDYQTLAASAPAGAEVLILGEKATLQDVADLLAGRTDLDAIHLISHGGEGVLILGGERIDSSNLDADTLAAIGASLGENGDILLYGCNVGADGQGQGFIDLVASLTGADVAASDDLTGSSSLGGDWDLETVSGFIETKSLSDLDYNHVLANEAFDNSLMRFGTGSEASVNAKGGLQQPFYYNSDTSSYSKLTIGTNPLNYAIALGGDGTNSYNLNGTLVTDQDWTGQNINVTGFTVTSGTKGYGTIVTTGQLTIGGTTIDVQNTYELGATSNFIKITTQITNNSGGAVSNIRYWVGTKDDYVGTNDQPTKTKGNITDSGATFTAITNATDVANGIRISSGTEIVQFYSDSTSANTVINNYNGVNGFAQVTGKDPVSSVITATAQDSAYGMYVRMNDLANGASDSFVWYYRGGTTASFAGTSSTPVTQVDGPSPEAPAVVAPPPRLAPLAITADPVISDKGGDGFRTIIGGDPAGSGFGADGARTIIGGDARGDGLGGDGARTFGIAGPADGGGFANDGGFNTAGFGGFAGFGGDGAGTSFGGDAGAAFNLGSGFDAGPAAGDGNIGTDGPLGVDGQTVDPALQDELLGPDGQPIQQPAVGPQASLQIQGRASFSQQMAQNGVEGQLHRQLQLLQAARNIAV